MVQDLACYLCVPSLSIQIHFEARSSVTLSGTGKTVMARQIGRLTALQVRRAKPGRHSDGGGLYLHVDKDGGRYWFFRWGAGGAKYASLGPTHTISLQQAREKARACRGLLIEGRDPKTERAAARLEAQRRQESFSKVAEQYFDNHKAAWGHSHTYGWRSIIRMHAEPTLGALPITDIDTDLVLKVLKPLWDTKTVTASRLRAQIEAVLDFAKARGLRDGENPARWRGHLKNLLASPGKLAQPEHYAALPFADVPAFMAELRKVPSTSARCLEFLILTAVRTKEARGALWEEILDDTWTISSKRMKAARRHRVPLSRAAREVLDKMQKEQGGIYIFPGYVLSGRGPIYKNALSDLLKKLRPGDVTVHGFRSTFRDWVSEQTSFSGEIAEMALAHAVRDPTEAAYRRGDLLEQRRKLMEAWANFCDGATGDVIPIRRQQHG
jgi:integrase